MDLEYMKQLRSRFAEQHIVSNEDVDKLQKLCENEAKITPQEEHRQSETFESLIRMTRQQRRAYERRLAKENRRKY